MTSEPTDVAETVTFPEIGVYAGLVTRPKTTGTVTLGSCSSQREFALILSGEVFPEAGTVKVLESYAAEGERWFGGLNGVFSGLLVDLRKQCAFLFVDRYGLERVYFHERGDEVYFASEAKALLRLLPELRDFDPSGVTDFLTFGCTIENRTLFRGIRLLPAGALWKFSAKGLSKTRYFSPREWEEQPELAPREFEEQFEETFKRVLPQYCEPAAELGISLTAGLDTRMIMACLPRGIPHPICYTFDTEGQESLDARIARRVAKTRGLAHETLRLNREFFANFAGYLDRTVYATDGCAGAMTAHEIPLNALARRLAPVRLTGNFGSEVLRSVSTFKPLHLAAQILDEKFVSAVAAAAEEAPNTAMHPVTFSAFREIPWKLFGTFAAARSQITFRTPFLDNAVVALAYRAPTALRLSPLPALRLIHASDPALSEIPTDRGEMFGSRGVRRGLRRFLGEATFKLDYLFAEGMPHALSRVDPLIAAANRLVPVLGLHKFLRYRIWYRHELASFVKDVLNDRTTQEMPFWAASFLPKLANDHITGRKNYVREISAVLTLEAVQRLMLRASSAD